MSYQKKSDFWILVHVILSKIEPKVSKVDPKNIKKRPIYEVKLFYATRCDHNLLYIDSIMNLDTDFSYFMFYACLRRGVILL